jgi:cytochrome c-type biogenesis protein CcmE
MTIKKSKQSTKGLCFLLVSIGIIFSFLSSCKYFVTPISNIVANPEKFENRTVIIRGTVISSQKLSSSSKEGSFIIDDGTEKMKVITTKDLPATGKKTFVRGKVRSNFVLFGKHFGVVIKVN